jgi:hypothetical protein
MQMIKIELATEACKLNCDGTAEDCVFVKAVERLNGSSALGDDEQAIIQAVGGWCLQVANGLRTAAEFTDVPSPDEDTQSVE